MFKKIEIWIVLLICVIFFIILILFGGIVRYDLKGGLKFKKIREISSFLSTIPENLKPSNLYLNYKRFTNPSMDSLVKINRHRTKERYKRYISKNRNELLLLARFDGNIDRSIVEIIDLNNFSTLHTFLPDIDEINRKTNTKKDEFKSLLIDHGKSRYRITHPLLLKNGDLVFHSNNSPLVKIDFCSNFIWLNDTDEFHHSNNKDGEGNYWVPTRMFPYSLDKKFVGKLHGNWADDAITKVSEDGKILFQKSISDIFFENNKEYLILGQAKYNDDPIHLNDIQPALSNSEYWNKGDLFLSFRSLSMIIQYRPSNNKIINILSGFFFHQHDVDIISNKEISIFNNNRLNTIFTTTIFDNSEILIYDFQTKKYYKKFNDTIAKIKMKTETGGLSEILDDGSILIEEQDYGRLIMIDNKGNLEWEFVNKNDKNETYVLNWSRIVDDSDTINNIKNMIDKKECQN